MNPALPFGELLDELVFTVGASNEHEYRATSFSTYHWTDLTCCLHMRGYFNCRPIMSLYRRQNARPRSRRAASRDAYIIGTKISSA